MGLVKNPIYEMEVIKAMFQWFQSPPTSLYFVGEIPIFHGFLSDTLGWPPQIRPLPALTLKLGKKPHRSRPAAGASRSKAYQAVTAEMA